MLKRVAGPGGRVSLLLAGHADLELRLALEDAAIVALPVSSSRWLDDCRRRRFGWIPVS